MSIRIKVKRIAAGRYEITTPSGTYELANCPTDTSDPHAAGLPSGPRWMLTYPGQYSADAEFRTKREAVEAVRADEAWEARKAVEETSAPDAEPAEPYTILSLGHTFAVRNNATSLDVAAVNSRYAAQHVIDCLADGRMVLDAFGRAKNAQVVES